VGRYPTDVPPLDDVEGLPAIMSVTLLPLMVLAVADLTREQRKDFACLTWAVPVSVVTFATSRRRAVSLLWFGVTAFYLGLVGWRLLGRGLRRGKAAVPVQSV
jgi:hypothetical protein